MALRELRAFRSSVGRTIDVRLVGIGPAPPLDVLVTLTLDGRELQPRHGHQPALPGTMEVLARRAVAVQGVRRTVMQGLPPWGLTANADFVVPVEVAERGDDWGEAIAGCASSERTGSHRAERR